MKTLKNSIYIFVTDWLRILKNPFTLIIIGGLMLLPSFYAWFNIEAMWDPYGNASNLPIGVYSDDIGFTLDDTYVNIGDEIISNLEVDENLDWQIPNSYDSLVKNVENGTYYGSIYIPKNFTERIMGILEGDYTKPHIEYRVNEKINAIAPKMTEAGAQGVDFAITLGFNKIASQTILSVFNNLGIEFENNMPLFDELFDEIDSLYLYATNFNEFLLNLDKFQIDLSNYTDSLENIDIEAIINALDNIVNNIHSLNQKTPDLLKFSEFVALINNSDFENLNNTFNNFKNTFSTTNITSFQNKIDSISKKVDTISTYDFSNLEDLLTSGEIKIEDAQSFINDINWVVDNSLNTIEGFANLVSQKSGDLANYINNNIPSNIDIILITTWLNNLNTNLANIEVILTNLSNILSTVLGSSNSLVIGLNNITNKVIDLENSISYVINNIGSINLNDVVNKLNTISSNASTIANKLNNLNINELNNNISTSLNTALEKIDLSQNTLEKIDLSSFFTSIENLLITLNTVSSNINNSITTFNNFYNNLNINSYFNNDFSLSKFNDFMENKLPTIATKINTLDTYLQNNWEDIKANLNSEIKLLLTKIPSLETVLEETKAFSNTTWPKVYDFLTTAHSTTNEIRKNKTLENISNFLINDYEQGSDFIASPVTTDVVRMYPIENYGSASTPFYTALCLWVGAVLLTSLLSTHFHNDSKKKLSHRDVFLGRFLTFAFIGIIQAIIVALGNIYLLHVYTVDPFLFILFSILIALSFNAIVYTIVNLFGNVGKAIAVILLVLSISGGGGNFPIEVSGQFFQVINPLLPFTHAVNLLREPIGGIYPPVVYKSILILFSYSTIFLLLGVIGAKYINPLINNLEAKASKSHIFH